MSLQLRRLSWHPEAALERIERLRRQALERGAEVLLAAAQRRVPHRTGELAGSARVDVGDDGATVAYEAEHGRFLRAHPEWNFAGGRSGRWLDEAVEEEAGAVGQVITDQMRSGWPG